MNQEAVLSAVELIQNQAQYNGHDLALLEKGLIPFATIGKEGKIGQVQYLAMLLKQCGCPEEWRLWMTGQLVGRTIKSSRDLSMAEASALLAWILDGADGQGQASADPDGPKHPCKEAVEVIGWLLDAVMAQGVVRAIGGRERVEVITQLGFA